MRRAVKKTRWSLLVILIVAGVLSYAGFRYFYPPQKSDIFAILPENSYGKVTLTGTIRKSSSLGMPGNYFLVLNDNRSYLILSKDLDLVVDSKVEIIGILDQPLFDGGLPILTIETLTTT